MRAPPPVFAAALTFSQEAVPDEPALDEHAGQEQAEGGPDVQRRRRGTSVPPEGLEPGAPATALPTPVRQVLVDGVGPAVHAQRPQQSPAVVGQVTHLQHRRGHEEGQQHHGGSNAAHVGVQLYVGLISGRPRKRHVAREPLHAAGHDVDAQGQRRRAVPYAAEGVESGLPAHGEAAPCTRGHHGRLAGWGPGAASYIASCTREGGIAALETPERDRLATRSRACLFSESTAQKLPSP